MIALVIAALLGTGGLSKDVIGKVVKRHQSEIRFCYEQQLQKDPSLAGKIVLDFSVGPSGHVVRAEIAEGSTLDSREVQACVLARVRKWEFPPPEGGFDVTVRFPFNFTSADAAPEKPEPQAAPSEPPPEEPAPAEEPARTDERDQARRDELWREADRPFGVIEAWEAGGAGMYPVLLGLLLGFASGALALALALSRKWQPALVAAGLCLGGAGWSFSCGWLGYVNGLMGAYSAVAHVNPADREIILHVAEREAAVCWKFGSIALGVNGFLGAAALGLALQRKRAANV